MHTASQQWDADHIIVMNKGKIVQQGNFDELLLQDGEFKRLAELAGMQA